MARRPAKKTATSAAKAVADKYIAARGGKKAAPKKPEDYELSAASIKKSTPPPEIRLVEIKAPAKAFTDKEATFVDEYLIDFNATQAAIRAGYSKKSAAEIGYENLRKPHIAAAIERAKRERAERAGMTADLQLADLLRDRFADIATLFDRNGAMKPLEEWPIEFRTGLVTGMDVEEIYAGTGEERIVIGRTLKPRFADRTAIKKLIGDHVGVQSWNHRRTLEVEEGSVLAKFMREVGGTSFRPRPQIDGAANPPPARPATIWPKG